ncbi:MAG: hypothetical protein Q9169_008354 [Polycauliona sp. 2 TL-2023]
MGSTTTTDTAPGNRLDVSIIGGGIAGVTLALGLLARGVRTTVYERSASFREIGAGIGFTANAERAMKVLEPRMHEAFKRVTVRNGTDWFMWMDGFEGGEEERRSGVEGEKEDDDDDALIHSMYLGERGFEGCHRADFLDELLKLLPPDTIQFCKGLDAIEDFGAETGKVRLRFTDGSSVETDTGCDGIRSRVRQLMLGPDDPASHPTYTHKYAYRGLVPMAAAKPVLGLAKTETRHMYLGQDGHVLTFPVAGGHLLNVVAFVSDPHDWPFPVKFTAPASKAHAVKAFERFNGTVRKIIGLLPDQLDKWAIFDTHDHPPPTFVRGNVCIAGDAAHAAAPYHGAGAGFAIEDGVVLAHVLQMVGACNGMDRSRAVRAALQAYDAVRIERARWLVRTSRFVGEMYQGQDEMIGRDKGRLAEEIEWRSRRIWDYDIDGMVREAGDVFEERLGGVGACV